MNALRKKALAGTTLSDQGYRILQFGQIFSLSLNSLNSTGGTNDVLPVMLGRKFPCIVRFFSTAIICLERRQHTNLLVTL